MMLYQLLNPFGATAPRADQRPAWTGRIPLGYYCPAGRFSHDTCDVHHLESGLSEVSVSHREDVGQSRRPGTFVAISVLQVNFKVQVNSGSRQPYAVPRVRGERPTHRGGVGRESCQTRTRSNLNLSRPEPINPVVRPQRPRRRPRKQEPRRSVGSLFCLQEEGNLSVGNVSVRGELRVSYYRKFCTEFNKTDGENKNLLYF